MKPIINILYSLVFIAMSTAVHAQSEQDSLVKAEEPINMTLKQFDKRIKHQKKPALVYFTADWCTVCKRQRPVLEEILVENNKDLELVIIDMESNPLIAEYFEVDALPVVILYVNGFLVWNRVGFQEKHKIMEYVNVFIPKK